MTYSKSNNKEFKKDVSDHLLEGLFSFLLDIPVNTIKLSSKVIKKVLNKRDARIVIGKNETNEVFIFPDTLYTHLLVSGSTGAGKSGFSINLAKKLINRDQRVLFLDPHGLAIGDVADRLKLDAKFTFLSLNQKNKHLGLNIFFVLGDKSKIEDHISHLIQSIFSDSLEEGYKVANSAKFILHTAVYFTPAYSYYLKTKKGFKNEVIGQIISKKQLTLNDIIRSTKDYNMQNLFLELYGDTTSPYYDKDIANKWLELSQATKQDTGVEGVLGRLNKLVLMESSRLFFESEGFNVLTELKKGNSVLCDLKSLDDHTMGTISKIIFSKVFNMHKKGELKGSTFMMIDEAKLIKIPNLTEIIEQARKFKLGLVLICQYVQQFENKNLELAINNTIVTKIKFQNETGRNAEETKELESLQTRHFNFKTRGFEYKNVKTVDYGKVVKQYKPVETGLTRYEIEAKIKAKKDNIYNYFTNINLLDYEPKNN